MSEQKTIDALYQQAHAAHALGGERHMQTTLGVIADGLLELIAATCTQGADDQQLRLIMERDEWRNAMAGLCCGPSENYSTPDKAASHLRKRLHPVGAEDAQPVALGYISGDNLNYLRHNATAMISPEGMREEDETIPVFLATRNTATRAQAPDSAAGLPPMQPLIVDPRGTVRFQENAIVRHLLDKGGIDMNDLGRLDFTDSDREQFAQLIGYSVGGYSELSYVSDESYERAAALVDATIAPSAHATNKDTHD
jgi:hypothetical protein